MIRQDMDSKYLLYMEPKRESRSKRGVNDEWTQFVEDLLEDGIAGKSKYDDPQDLGTFKEDSKWGGARHECEDGQKSDNYDYLLIGGYITNSLAAYYMRWYRKEITESDWQKIKEIKKLVR